MSTAAISEGIVNVAPSVLVMGTCLFGAACLPGIVHQLVKGKKKRLGMTKWDYFLEDRDKRVVERRNELAKLSGAKK